MFRSYCVIVTLGCAFLVGCGSIDADITQVIKYDENNDSFDMLVVFENIAVTTTDVKQKGIHYAYLGDLWRNRDDLIIFGSIDMPSPSNGPIVMLYEENHLYRHINLDKIGSRPPLTSTTINLDRIHVKPGQFFIGRNGSLTYFHQISIGGEELDRYIAEGLSELNDMLKTDFSERLRDARREMKVLKPDEADPKYIFGDFPDSVTLAYSLDNPIVDIRRREHYLILSMIVSPDDSKKLDAQLKLFFSHSGVTEEAVALRLKDSLGTGTNAAVNPSTRGISVQQLQELIKDGMSRELHAAEVVRDSFKTEYVASLNMTRVTVTVDLLDWLNQRPPNREWSRIKSFVTPDARLAESAATITALRASGIPISIDESLERILTNFRK